MGGGRIGFEISGIGVHANTIEASLNSILKNWRDLWPGGLGRRAYSTLNLMAECRGGGLGYNRAQCTSCKRAEWYASSCGDRHCPRCLGPRQAQWSQEVCDRLPDCPHFHVVFTVPEEFGGFFEANYRLAASMLFAAAAEVISLFQENNWGVRGGFFGVLHTWGSALNWHPHLHFLVSAGGAELAGGGWKGVRGDYMFPVKSMSEVFRAVVLRRVEAADADAGVRWPAGLGSLEQRRGWRLRLARKNWNIFTRPTLGNTRAVVRYLARYTSRIAMSNRRITRVDAAERTVSFEVKDYRRGGRKVEKTLPAAAFLRRFARHLVPKGLRRIRYYGLLAGGRRRMLELAGGPRKGVGEAAVDGGRQACRHCGGQTWAYTAFHQVIAAVKSSLGGGYSYPLAHPRAGPDPPGKASNKWMETNA